MYVVGISQGTASIQSNWKNHKREVIYKYKLEKKWSLLSIQNFQNYLKNMTNHWKLGDYLMIQTLIELCGNVL